MKHALPRRMLASAAGLLMVLLVHAGCTTILFETVDIASEKAAEQEGPIGDVGKTTQKGVAKVEETKEAAIQKAKEAVD